jgi:hypothetical protein
MVAKKHIVVPPRKKPYLRAILPNMYTAVGSLSYGGRAGVARTSSSSVGSERNQEKLCCVLA